MTGVNLEAEPETVEVTALVGAGEGSVEIPMPAEGSTDCWTGGISAFADPGTQPDHLAGLSPPYTVTVKITIDERTLVADPVVWPADLPDDSDERPILTLTG